VSESPRALDAPLSADLPHDVDSDLLRPGRDLASIDGMFDVLSWRTFVALVWPLQPDGTSAPSLAGAGVPRWRTFRDVRDLVPPHGLRPWRWEVARDEKGVSLRNHEVTDPRFRFWPREAQADGNILWDQNGHPVRYEALVNRATFDHVVAHGLYQLEGQRQARPVYLPQGLYWDKSPRGGQTRESDPARQGSITMKLAWKVLAPHDDPGRFYTQTIPVQDDPGGVQARRAGLVGMHVAHKTQSSASWVWSTFEHVDALDPHDRMTGWTGRPLFRDPDSLLPANVVPRPDPTGARRTQVGRVVPVSAATERLNQRFRSMLREAGSPWSHYRLLGTQRLARTRHYRESSPVPPQLSNPLFETYVPPERASAIAAHQAAALAASPEGGTSAASDFMFLLRRAVRPWARAGEIDIDPGGDGPLGVAGAPLSPALVQGLCRHGLAPSEDAQLEWLVPALEWLVVDRDRTLVLRRESSAALTLYYPP
jgi:hypothetical protein